MDTTRGILLFGHGARNPEWAAPFYRIRDAIIERQPTICVEMGFLELMRPTLDESIDTLVSRGVTQMIIVPIFMAAGVHIRKDCTGSDCLDTVLQLRPPSARRKPDGLQGVT